MKPNILSFLQETLQRLFTKSPKFFKIWMIISGTLVLITGIPDWIRFTGITIPNLWNHDVTLAVAWASRAATFMAILTSKSPIVAVTVGGNVLKATDDTKLPFTAAVEQKAAVKEQVPKVDEKVIS